MTTTTTTPPLKPFDYKRSAETILKTLRRDRDREIIAQRFGFELPKRQTLEKIGQHFGITRERVRQIEKTTLAKIVASKHPQIAQAEQLLSVYIAQLGGLASVSVIGAKLGANTPQQRAYLVFLATLSDQIEVIDESDLLRQSFSLKDEYPLKTVRALAGQILDVVATAGVPVTSEQIASNLEVELPSLTLANLLDIHKGLANFEQYWGLLSWPQVNPKSIRDKTYLVMNKHGQPLHFSAIADRIRASDFQRRDVTIQAVHNELIKDARFILIGRGIYALAEWGYAPGTVADIIVDILREEQPLHKDEIVKRVLEKRQVKTTTIVLNLQEKAQFERVAKATYKLKG